MNEYEDAEFKATVHRQSGYPLMTSYGVIAVFETNGFDFTVMHFASNGVWYRRTWKQGFADRTLITLAKRFAAEKAGI